MYYILKSVRKKSYVYVSAPPSFKNWYEITNGVSLLDRWPDGATLRFSEDRPEGMLLTDRISNSFGLLIASKKFKDLLEQLKLDYFEFLPVGFLDHKGRPRKEPYWIVNFTKLVSAVNREQSICEDSIGGTLDYFEKLVLIEEIEKNGPPVFSLKEQPTMILFRQDFKEQIDKLGLTGFRLVPTNEYTTIG